MIGMISLSNFFELMFIPTSLAHLLTPIFCKDHNMKFGWKICKHPFGIRLRGRMFDIGGWNVVVECWGNCPLAYPTMMVMVGLMQTFVFFDVMAVVPLAYLVVMRMAKLVQVVASLVCKQGRCRVGALVGIPLGYCNRNGIVGKNNGW